eukprot:SAG31_NODE_2316_length_5951_cov_7.632262_7_plen_484_part_00
MDDAQNPAFLGTEDQAAAADQTLKDAGPNLAEVMVPMPHLFEGWQRLVCRPDGSPRMLVRFAPYVFGAACVAVPAAMIQVFKYGRTLDAKNAAQFSDIEFVRQALQICCFSSGILYLPALHRAIQPETGTLVLLGAGVKAVPAAQVRALRLWKKLMIIPTVLFVLWALFGIYVGTLLTLHVTKISPVVGQPGMDAWAHFLPALPLMCLSLACGWPAACVWYVTLKAGVLLSRGDVQEVVDATNPTVLTDEAMWSTRVAQPAFKLATNTMPNLSRYGNGVGLAALVCLAGSIASFIGVVHDILTPPETTEDEDDGINDGGTGRARKIVAMIGTALAPILLAKDVADVSSLCDVLLNSINELRLKWDSTAEAQETHSLTFPLQCTLERLNGGQGLGFCVFTKVIDKKALNMIVLSVLSFFGTVVPLVLTTLEDPISTGGEHICLSADECAMAGSALAEAAWRHDQCINRNLTVGSILEGMASRSG